MSTEEQTETTTPTMAELLPVRRRKVAELFAESPKFGQRAMNVQRSILSEVHTILEANADDMMDQIDARRNAWINLARRKLKQGRAWSREKINALVDRYIEHFNEKQAEAEADANIEVVADGEQVVTDADDESGTSQDSV